MYMQFATLRNICRQKEKKKKADCGHVEEKLVLTGNVVLKHCQWVPFQHCLRIFQGMPIAFLIYFRYSKSHYWKHILLNSY